MSHPGAISRRCSLTISRSRRRMRLRRTAVPRAFFMLQPKRLRSSPFGRTNSANSRPVRRRPSRYTASYSARRSKRQVRGKSSAGASDARETVASFPAASRKHLFPTLAFHTCAEAVFLVSGPHMGLKRAFRQRSISSIFAGWPVLAANSVRRISSRTQANPVVYSTAAARSRKPGAQKSKLTVRFVFKG